MQLTARSRPFDGGSTSSDGNEKSPVNRNPPIHHIDRHTHDGAANVSDNTAHSEKVRRKYALSKNSFIVVWVRKANHTWKLLSSGSKVATVLIIVFLIQHILIGLWDKFFHRVGGVKVSTQVEKSVDEKFFAVAINTYKRPDMLRDAVQHYAEICGKGVGVSQVFVIWAEQGVQVPDATSFFQNSNKNVRKMDPETSASANRAEVKVLKKSKDSLNSRFEPIHELQSTAVFMVDDDLRVSCPSLAHAFHAWKANPDSMVGYYPRLASPPRKDAVSQTELIYHTWPVVFWRQRFNFVLTKAAFLHSKYLELYTSDSYPKSIKDHVDEHMNCEDIAMSMLVANHTKYTRGSAAYPIYVEGSVSDKGLIGGISTGPGHMVTRSDCLTRLNSIFVEQGWGSPLTYEAALSQYSWIVHAPGVWWQSRPSNPFEWLAFANTFT